jgi:hypothetical protein
MCVLRFRGLQQLFRHTNQWSKIICLLFIFFCLLKLDLGNLCDIHPLGYRVTHIWLSLRLNDLLEFPLVFFDYRYRCTAIELHVREVDPIFTLKHFREWLEPLTWHRRKSPRIGPIGRFLRCAS